MQGGGAAGARRLRLPHNRSSPNVTDAPLSAERFHQAGSNQRQPPIRVQRTASSQPRCRRELSQQSCPAAMQGQKNPQSPDPSLAAEFESLSPQYYSAGSTEA